MTRLWATIPLDDGGGSSLLKVMTLADLIVAGNLRRVVEIGVYRGRLLLPLAMTMASLGRGEAVGIDPYSAAAAVQTDDHNRGLDLVEWPRSVDWDALYEETWARIEHWGLADCCRLLRARSADVAAAFDVSSVDLLHVDGNHDRDAVARDVELFLPKVRPGGFVVLDDASWQSVRPTCDSLRASHELILQVVDPHDVLLSTGQGNDFAVFRVTS
ncbi:MAG: class I SAM-dependent methyltransferase [Actinobacteria bacterium]|nr:MAG: class I SAM-dependent methyltransferase [Actinomycetota bacterium]